MIFIDRRFRHTVWPRYSKALEEVEGVPSAKADRESETATVEGDADTDVLVEAVTDAGYEVSA